MSVYSIIRSMQNFLSHSERNKLKALHKQERDKRICYRINAVLLYDKGWTHSQIADALLQKELENIL